jgi:hypothetical protein
MGWSLVQRSPTEYVCVCVFDCAWLAASTARWSRSDLGCSATDKKAILRSHPPPPKKAAILLNIMTIAFPGYEKLLTSVSNVQYYCGPLSCTEHYFVFTCDEACIRLVWSETRWSSIVEIAVNSLSLVNWGGWEEREAGSEKPISRSFGVCFLAYSLA